MKPGPATSALSTSGSRARSGGERFGQRARIRAGRLGFARIDHRRVGREIAVRGLARRLDDEAAEIEVARQLARRDALLEQRGNARLEIGENVHCSTPRRVGAAGARASIASRRRRQKGGACSAIAKRSVMPAM